MILAEVLSKAGRDERERTYYKAVVMAVDLDGGQLQNPDGDGELIVVPRDGSTKKFKASVGPSNPRGSVKARVITDGFDRLLGEQDLRVFWPMFPQDISGVPVTPGEHVYVIFDGVGTSHGLWVSRVAGHESANSSDGASNYDAPSSPQTAMDSFEENPPEYPRDDLHASLAPTDGAMDKFEGG